MKIAVPPRQRRLLALCACSAALHLALLALFARQGGGMAPAVAPSAERLVLRLAPPASSAPPPRVADAPPAPPPAAPRPPARARTGAASAPPASAAIQPGGLAQPADQAPAPPTPPLPGRYRVRLPASAALTYVQTEQRPGAAAAQAAGAAHLNWQTDGQHYLLRADGVLGRLASEGARGDTGLLPQGATEDGAGGALRTTFEHEAGRVRFDAGGPDAPAALGIQDRASLLVQLAGMGLAAPDQLQGTIAVVVADAHAAALLRFEVVCVEDLETGLGTLPAWHLAEVAAPGRPRLDVWLAPDQEWLPVRVRVTRADGTVATQTVSAVTRAAAQ